MILFLNFAPLSFGGGAERWIIDIQSATSVYEKTMLVDVDSHLANFYGKLVIKRPYIMRLKSRVLANSKKHVSLHLKHFIPFTKQWKQIKQLLTEARYIYIRFEFLEAGIVWYFGGTKMLHKTVAGLHSPFVYANPISFIEKLHNILYGSFISKWLLSQMNKIHVLNLIDYQLLKKRYNLADIHYIPNFISNQPDDLSKNLSQDATIINIAFIGELNMRKGVDRLINTIIGSPNTFRFHIAGDGPMKSEIEKLQILSHMRYYGYLKKQQVHNLLASCDVLFLPSRAESFALTSLEAMSYGLPIISSKETDIAAGIN